MSPSVLNKVWSFLVVTCLYLCLNVWSITQKWQLSLPGNPFKDSKTTPFGVGLYGIVLCGALIIVIGIVTRLYAMRSESSIWVDRLPHFADFELDATRSGAKAFQAISICIFLLVPLTGLLHFQNKFLHGSVYRLKSNCTPSASNDYCRGQSAVIQGWQQMLFAIPHDGVPGRLVYDPDLPNDIAPTFIPIFEPWGLLFLTIVASGFLIWGTVPAIESNFPRKEKATEGQFDDD